MGGILERGPFTLTADLFRIDVEDRLTLTQLYSLRPEEVDDLVAEGVTSASNLQNFRFFTNDFATRTAGLDVIATWSPPQLGGHTDFSFLLNHTDTKVTDFNSDTLSQRRLRSLQEGLPETRHSLTVKHKAWEERLRLLGRFSYYSSWFDFDNAHTSRGKHLLDLELAYSLKRDITLAIGGRNVFNTYPDENPIALERRRTVQRELSLRIQRRLLLRSPQLFLRFRIQIVEDRLTYSTFEGPCRSSLIPRPRPLTTAALPNFSRTASSAFSTLLSVDPMPPKSSPWATWPASTRS